MYNPLTIKRKDGRCMKAEIILPNTTETQAQRLAARFNSEMLDTPKDWRRYVVLDVFPHTEPPTKRVVLLR